MATASLIGRETFDLGPCSVAVDTASGGANLDLGDSESVTVSIETEKAEMKGAKYGTAPANRTVTGQKVMIKMIMAQATLERLAQTLQGFRLNTNTAGTILGFSYGSAIGEDDLSIAKQMTLTRWKEGADSSDTFDAIDFWLAAASGTAELLYDASTQRNVALEFMCYLSENHLDSEGKPTFFGSGVYA